MKASILLLSLLSMSFSACVSQQRVQDRLNEAWTGKNFDEFVLTYGTPKDKFALNSGDTAYLWNSGTASIDVPTYATTRYSGDYSQTQVSGGGSIKMFCELQIVADGKGIIKQIKIMKDTWGMWVSSRCHEVFK